MKWTVRILLGVVFAVCAGVFYQTFEIAPLYSRDAIPRSVLITRWICLLVGVPCLTKVWLSFFLPREGRRG